MFVCKREYKQIGTKNQFWVKINSWYLVPKIDSWYRSILGTKYGHSPSAITTLAIVWRVYSHTGPGRSVCAVFEKIKRVATLFLFKKIKKPFKNLTKLINAKTRDKLSLGIMVRERKEPKEGLKHPLSPYLKDMPLVIILLIK